MHPLESLVYKHGMFTVRITLLHTHSGLVNLADGSDREGGITDCKPKGCWRLCGNSEMVSYEVPASHSTTDNKGSTQKAQEESTRCLKIGNINGSPQL